MIQSVEKIYLNNLDDVESFNYKLTYTDGTIWSVPYFENNRHYQEILELVADGNTIQEAD